MFLTKENLVRHKACKKGIRFFEQNYPQGAEILDIIRNPIIPKEMLHWGWKKLPYNETEKTAYLERINVQNSDGIYYCENVENSFIVSKSSEVYNSKYVFSSQGVKHSNSVVASEEVENSSQIFSSNFVDNCKKILLSNNVVDSSNICKCSSVFSSKNILGSTNISDCNNLRECTNATNSFMCFGCNNISSCLFCVGLDNKQYCVFNTQVDENRFNLFLKQYIKYTSDLNFTTYWPSDFTFRQSPSIKQKISKYYEDMSEKFWSWVKTLPGYTEELVYILTHLHIELLKEYTNQ